MSPPETSVATAQVEGPAVRSVEERMDDVALRVQEALPVHAHWLPRLAVASVFLYHGFSKFTTIDGFAEMFGLSTFVAFTVAYAEVAAGLLLLLGGLKLAVADIATRVGGALVIPVMLGAIVKAHWSRWSFVPDADAGYPMGGMEFQLLLIAIGLFFVMRGAPAVGD